MPHETAVCPDGTFYLANYRGDIMAVDPNGGVIANLPREEAFIRVRALACDANGLIYAAGERGLAVVRRTGPVFRVERNLVPFLAIGSLALAPDGRIFASGYRGGSRQNLHVIAPDGRLLKSFGDFERGIVLPVGRPEVFLLWQDRPERLVAIRPDPYGIRAYSPDGALLDIFTPRRGGMIHPVQASTGEVIGAAPLPGGRIAVQLRAYGPWRVNQPDGPLDILNRNFEIETPALPALPGTLAGASRDGGMYFLDVSRGRFRLYKGHLPGAAGPPVLA